MTVRTATCTLLLLFMLAIALNGCAPAASGSAIADLAPGGLATGEGEPPAGEARTSAPSRNQSTSSPVTTPAPTLATVTRPVTVTATARARATVTIPPSPAPPPTATPLPSPTPIQACNNRLPQPDDLLVAVTLQHGLSRDYAPPDLVPIADYLPQHVTMGYPTELRVIVIEPLVAMIDAMQAAGLQPQVISGYRSYAAQAIAWNKWNERYPEHASIISAPPGHSEHQLGTVVDFGSPSLDDIVGEEGIEFHTYFYKTPEGIWLAENAYRYGFTLSFPAEAFEVTGFYYEPWHYRYVGVEVATALREKGVTLIEEQLHLHEDPCTP